MEHVWGIPLALAYLCIFIVLLRRWAFFTGSGLSKKAITVFFLYKVFLGFVLTLIYTYYYTERSEADIYKYFDDSYHMTRALWEKPGDFFKMLFGIGNDSEHFTADYYSKMDHWFRRYETQVYNDNHTMIRINAAMRLFSGGYFHIHTLFFGMLSFIGIVSFYRGFSLFLDKNKHGIFAICLFLFPSLAFWSAGALKESILIFSLGNLFYLVCLLVNKQINKAVIVLGIFSLILALYLKSYALAALAVGLAGLVTGSIFKNKKMSLVYFCLCLIGTAALFAFTKVYPDYDVPAIIAQKQHDFYRLSEYMKAGSTYEMPYIKPTWTGLLSATPWAFFTGLFRPTLLETFNPIMLPSAIESLLIMTGLVFCLFCFDKPQKQQVNMLLCCAVIIVILCTVIGLATVNFGSLVRYKVPVLPFIIFVIVCLIDFTRLKFLKQIADLAGTGMEILLAASEGI